MELATNICWFGLGEAHELGILAFSPENDNTAHFLPFYSEVCVKSFFFLKKILCCHHQLGFYTGQGEREGEKRYLPLQCAYQRQKILVNSAFNNYAVLSCCCTRLRICQSSLLIP